MTKWTIFTGLIIAEVLFGIIVPWIIGAKFVTISENTGLLLAVERWTVGAAILFVTLGTLMLIGFIVTFALKATHTLAEELTNKNPPECEEVEYEGYH